ncbi:hypothetical protein AB6D11_06090 [Vibrio splendidus]
MQIQKVLEGHLSPIGFLFGVREIENIRISLPFFEQCIEYVLAYHNENKAAFIKASEIKKIDTLMLGVCYHYDQGNPYSKHYNPSPVKDDIPSSLRVHLHGKYLTQSVNSAKLATRAFSKLFHTVQSLHYHLLKKDGLSSPYQVRKINRRLNELMNNIDNHFSALGGISAQDQQSSILYIDTMRTFILPIVKDFVRINTLWSTKATCKLPEPIYLSPLLTDLSDRIETAIQQQTSHVEELPSLNQGSGNLAVTICNHVRSENQYIRMHTQEIIQSMSE